MNVVLVLALTAEWDLPVPLTCKDYAATARSWTRGITKAVLLHPGEPDTNGKLWPTKITDVYDDPTTNLNFSAASVPLLPGEVVGVGRRTERAPA